MALIFIIKNSPGEHLNIRRRRRVFMKRPLKNVIFSLWFIGLTLAASLAAASESDREVSLKSAHLLINLKNGHLQALIDRGSGKNYFAPEVPAPLLSLRINDKDQLPLRMEQPAPELLRLHFPGASADIAVKEYDSHISFELLHVSNQEKIQLINWGPYPTNINETIGEIIGVVRNRDFAIGIQALNSKTRGGGSPGAVKKNRSVSDKGAYPGLSPYLNQLFKYKKYRGNTAAEASFGSLLQAHCRDLSRDRVISNMGHQYFQAPAIKDGGILGSKIALFGCPANEALDTIGQIEIAEGLPHPMIKGRWYKQSSEATASHLITDIDDQNIDRAIKWAKRAGLHQLYSFRPFESWGNFKMKGEFKNGRKSLKANVDKAAHHDISVGLKTLSNFITPNDAYVSPAPDPRLAKVGTTQVSTDISLNAKVISIEDPLFFQKNTTLNTVMIGSELITYEKVSTSEPWQLQDCKRGAWGTRPAQHRSGSSIAKLLDHPWKVFLSNTDLSREIAENIAQLSNETGVSFIALDGLEGNLSTGLGDYGRSLFAEHWYNNLDPGFQGGVGNEASNPEHFYWHINTHFGWGEQFSHDLRTWQWDRRINYQFLYRRNLLPSMLGFFTLRPVDCADDIEWVMSKSAGFDAGVLMTINEPKHPQLNDCLDAIREWETARMAQAFPPELKLQLQVPRNEFHLEAVSPGKWRLHQYFSYKEKYIKNHQVIPFENPYSAQALQFTIKNQGSADIKNLKIHLNGQDIYLLNSVFKPGEIMRHTGQGTLMHYTQDWKILNSEKLPLNKLHCPKGLQGMTLTWKRSLGKAKGKQALDIDFRTVNSPITLSAKP